MKSLPALSSPHPLSNYLTTVSISAMDGDGDGVGVVRCAADQRFLPGPAFPLPAPPPEPFPLPAEAEPLPFLSLPAPAAASSALRLREVLDWGEGIRGGVVGGIRGYGRARVRDVMM